jgi:FdrA protein
MTVLRAEIRRGAYHDSIVLMRLQAALAGLPGIADAGVVMGTEANLALLSESGLLPEDLGPVAPDDLVAVVRVESRETAGEALARLDELLHPRRDTGSEGAFRPKSLASAVQALPEARWVTVSVPGRWAAEVAREALALGRHVFLYSDNVPLGAEVELKTRAAEKGLLVLGPDCGTAVVGGVGLGFANRVRRGAVGLVGASGTGLQTVASRLHALGGGISHALGTGGRDLAAEVGAATASAALDLLARDPETRVVVLVSKPPAAEVAARLLAAGRGCGKPVVVCFLGRPVPARRLANLHFAASLAEAAEIALQLAEETGPERAAGLDRGQPPPAQGASRRFLRALFSGGTLGQEALLSLTAVLSPVASNLRAPGSEPLADPAASRGHTVVDLGADELTAGRPHPMLEPSLVAERLARETADPETAAVLFDVVLGDGAHPDPAGVLAPALEELPGDRPALVAVVVGTDEDPQGLEAQTERLRQAGVTVFNDLAAAVDEALEALPREQPPRSSSAASPAAPVPLDALAAGPAVINVGVEVFYDSLRAQGGRAVHVDWRPPAGGDERLAAILAKMKGSG